MVYACFLEWNIGGWTFQYVANDEEERDRFIEMAKDMMSRRLLGRQVINYSVHGLAS